MAEAALALSDDQKEEAAARLRAVYGGAPPIPPLRDFLGVNDVNLGYEIQEINTDHWLKQGRRLVGRKIGATSAAVQKMLGLDQPDYGMLYADMAFTDAEEVPVSRLYQPRVEGEIAFYLGRDLPEPDLTIAEIVKAVDYAVAAIEIVDSRIKDWDIRILDTIADNASSGLFVLGTEPRSLKDFDPRLCGMVLERRGEPISTGAGAACLGNPLTAMLWLARKMAAVCRPLKAGDVVLSGALGPLVPVNAGDVCELRISGLGSVRTVFSNE